MKGQEAIELVDLKAVKVAAQKKFGNLPSVNGFGIGDGVLRAYVRDAKAKKDLPDVFEGIPIEFIVTGDITAASR